MNVMEQADLARRMIDDPLITIRRSELREALYEYGDTQRLKGIYGRWNEIDRDRGECPQSYAQKWDAANVTGWRLFYATIHPKTFG